MWESLKARLLKYEAIHGLYKIPLGIVLLYIVFSNLTLGIIFSSEIFQLRYILHIVGAIVGFRAVIEGLHDLFHDPVEKEIALQNQVVKREETTDVQSPVK